MRANGPRQIAFRDEGNGEIGGLAVVRDRHIEMVHAGPDVANDRSDLRTAIGYALAGNEDPDRLIVFSDALRRHAELQFGAERDLEKAVRDLIIGKIRSLGRAPAADVGI